MLINKQYLNRGEDSPEPTTASLRQLSNQLDSLLINSVKYSGWDARYGLCDNVGHQVLHPNVD